ncbi:hypothetical protein BC834DRAFT_146441 [Gloeopeniophorella convolvens]|nr:hypothetical protein BC834DRAFT_146441 [Gloeopeniophorella convolvens]
MACVKLSPSPSLNNMTPNRPRGVHFAGSLVGSPPPSPLTLPTPLTSFARLSLCLWTFRDIAILSGSAHPPHGAPGYPCHAYRPRGLGARVALAARHARLIDKSYTCPCW